MLKSDYLPTRFVWLYTDCSSFKKQTNESLIDLIIFRLLNVFEFVLF